MYKYKEAALSQYVDYCWCNNGTHTDSPLKGNTANFLVNTVAGKTICCFICRPRKLIPKRSELNG